MLQGYRRCMGTLALAATLAGGCGYDLVPGRGRDPSPGEEVETGERAESTAPTSTSPSSNGAAGSAASMIAMPVPVPEPVVATVDPALDACEVEASDGERLEAMAEALDESVHELIKCGQLQTGIAGNLLAILLASNEQLFESSTEYEILLTAANVLGFMTDVPLAQREDGTWELQIGSAGTSRFEIVFFDPDSGEAIVVDPFVIDSYLEGARVDSSESMLEMLLYPHRRATFTVRFEAEGPLAHVLAEGAPVPNPFEVRLSLSDLLDLAEGDVASPEDGGPDFGPLASLSRLDMSSAIRLRDERGEISVHYDAAGMRDQLRVVARSGVGFELDALVAEDPQLRLSASPSALQFVPGVGLAGEVELSLESGRVRLRSDYAEGTDVPARSWVCGDGE